VRQLAVMCLLAETTEPLGMIAMTGSLNVSKSCISRNADFLEFHGFIERIFGHDDNFDMRRLYLRLTNEGRKFLVSMGVVP
jgi:DNA-binding MarR family transcriptional regulator